MQKLKKYSQKSDFGYLFRHLNSRDGILGRIDNNNITKEFCFGKENSKRIFFSCDSNNKLHSSCFSLILQYFNKLYVAIREQYQYAHVKNQNNWEQKLLLYGEFNNYMIHSKSSHKTLQKGSKVCFVFFKQQNRHNIHVLDL